MRDGPEHPGKHEYPPEQGKQIYRQIKHTNICVCMPGNMQCGFYTANSAIPLIRCKFGVKKHLNPKVIMCFGCRL